MGTTQVGLIPEFEEEETNLATDEAGEDIFEHISEALKTKHGGHQGPDAMRDKFQQVQNWKENMDAYQLGELLEQYLHIALADNELHQLHAVTKSRLWFGHGGSSLSQFIKWWEAQCGIQASDDPYQVALAQLAASNMMSPNGRFRGNWDLAQAILLFYVAVVLPYRIGFDHNVLLWTFWFWWDLCVDIYFIVDLFLNFRTAVVTPEGDLMFDKKQVARSYFRGWFTIDFVSCLPLSYLEYVMAHDDSKGNQNRMVRLLRLFRLLKLLRLVRIKRILDRYDEG